LLESANHSFSPWNPVKLSRRFPGAAAYTTPSPPFIRVESANMFDAEQMKSIFKFAMLALILVIVAMISGLTAMRFAIHGQEVAVPPLVGLTPAEAERAISAPGLQVSIERQYYSPQIPEGRIMSQLPLPGTKVRRGWQVRVAQSLGPTRVAVPDVTGQSEHAAELNIKRRGLDISSLAQVDMPGIPADQVLAQNPTANAAQLVAPKISLLVSGVADPQAYVMPSFIGQPLGSASRTLQDAGFRLGNVSVAAIVELPADQATSATPGPPVQPSPSSIVVSQSPAAGQKVTGGSTVSFEVR
jgi:beta-lactam-binding protein with PASTA domain